MEKKTNKVEDIDKNDVVKPKKYVKSNKIVTKPLVVEKEVDIVVVNDKISDTTDVKEEN